MARSIALTALLFALPIAAETITNTPVNTGTASIEMTGPSFTVVTTVTRSDGIDYVGHIIPETTAAPEETLNSDDVTYIVYSTQTRSDGIDYVATAYTRVNGTFPAAAQPTAVVDNAGSGLVVKSAGLIAGLSCALAIML
ncbi:hypothetical protein NW768_007555 [Fusarium equiseti]|uniref:Uncharacterized protein n=1 Tax=Fusarium equiseti TaxID=61235 RepID=A0ABQ8R848_FUSEQ|nr:hypothetical protein NW768_007555 [Fusarium equiseti]